MLAAGYLLLLDYSEEEYERLRAGYILVLQVQSLSRQIEKLKEEKKGFIKLLASKTITEADYKEGTKSDNEEIATLQSKLVSLTANNSNSGAQERDAVWL